MIIVSDTSPIINLAMIGKLELLQLLFETVLIPEAVFHEITVKGAGQPGALEVQSLPWFQVRTAINRPLVTALASELDPGEAEAIALAVELDADVILLDERRGRRVAARFDLRYLGLFGILLEAKRRGLITEVKTAVEDLIVRAGFWVDEALFRRVLELAGENISSAK